MAEMILVCGLSGSGKTDWAKEFVENTGYRYFVPTVAQRWTVI